MNRKYNRFLLLACVVILSACEMVEEAVLDADTSEQLWLPASSFRELPVYIQSTELLERPASGVCQDSDCHRLQYNGEDYYYAYIVNNESSNIILGSWTGGSCENDYWHINPGNSFSSSYPEEDGHTYAWWGSYRFEGNLHIEEGTNNSGKPEYNVANLYYVPAIDSMLYKGIKSLDYSNEINIRKFTYHEGPEYVYLRRCDPP